MDHPVFTEAIILAVSKHLNAVPYLCGGHEPSRLPLEETVPGQPCLLVDTRFPVCTSLTPIPTMVFGLGMRRTYKIVCYAMDSSQAVPGQN